MHAHVYIKQVVLNLLSANLVLSGTNLKAACTNVHIHKVFCVNFVKDSWPCSKCVSALRSGEPAHQKTGPTLPSPWPQSPGGHTPVENRLYEASYSTVQAFFSWGDSSCIITQCQSHNKVLCLMKTPDTHCMSSCCFLVTHLYKHSKEEVGAELLHSLGHCLLVVAVHRLFLDLTGWQPEVRPALCMQATSGQAWT